MPDRPACIIPATAAHVEYVGAMLREEHIREIEETTWVDPRTAIRVSFEQSAVSFTVMGATGPMIVLGGLAAGALTGASEVWMLGTRSIDYHPVRTLRASRWAVAAVYRETGADRLEQWIPAWYETGIRFVERLGFVRQGGGPLVRVVHSRRGNA